MANPTGRRLPVTSQPSPHTPNLQFPLALRMWAITRKLDPARAVLAHLAAKLLAIGTHATATFVGAFFGFGHRSLS